MSTETVNQIVDRLAQAGPLEPERFAALLGAPLKPADENPYWKFYTFELGEGPFARGELRLNTAGNAALLSLQPRDPPGLTAADIDRSAWGPRLSLVPNPRIPPEGADTEIFRKDGVQVSTQWWHNSRKLRSLVLEWEPRQTAEPPMNAAPRAANPN
jgi:hypothetical protein